MKTVRVFIATKFLDTNASVKTVFAHIKEKRRSAKPSKIAFQKECVKQISLVRAPINTALSLGGSKLKMTLQIVEKMKIVKRRLLIALAISALVRIWLRYMDGKTEAHANQRKRSRIR